MVFLVFSWKEWVSDIEFIENASETPHVDGRIVGDAQHDLRSSVEPALDVGVDLLCFEAATAEVDDFDA